MYFYKCERCKHGFELSESATYIDNGEKLEACPNCGSAALEEAKQCKRCGEIVYPWVLHSGVCPECLSEIILKYRRKINEMEDDELEVLNDEYGEIDITKREE